jgi:hypothetical protein
MRETRNAYKNIVQKLDGERPFSYSGSVNFHCGTELSINKVKSDPATRHGGAWGERTYSSYSFSTSALDGGELSASRPGRALPPGKRPPVHIE